MKNILIENPVLAPLSRSQSVISKFCDEGITNEVIDERRKSFYFVLIAGHKKKGSSLPSQPNGYRTGLRKMTSSTSIGTIRIRM